MKGDPHEEGLHQASGFKEGLGRDYYLHVLLSWWLRPLPLPACVVFAVRLIEKTPALRDGRLSVWRRDADFLLAE